MNEAVFREILHDFHARREGVEKQGEPNPPPDVAVQAAQDSLAPVRAWVVREVNDGDQAKAVLICSAILEDHFWLILNRDFNPGDGLATYYPEELPILKTKSHENLRQIHRVKLIFPGSRVTQGG